MIEAGRRWRAWCAQKQSTTSHRGSGLSTYTHNNAIYIPTRVGAVDVWVLNNQFSQKVWDHLIETGVL